MGLLDILGGNDPQQQGLLAAAAGILNASGPSLMPRSFGQVVGAGLGGFQQGQQQALAQQAARQNFDINNVKLRDAESDLKNQEIARQQAEKLRQFYMQDGQPQTSAMPAPQSAAASFGAAMQPQAPQMPQAPTVPQAGGQNVGVYQQRMALADRLRKAGFNTEADAQEAAALKFQPKVKEWSKVAVGGKVMYAPYFEDGTSGQPVPLEVAEKLQFQNLGNKTVGLNPFTGSQVSSYGNTMSPDAAAANSIANQRLGLDRQKFDFEKQQGNAPSGYRFTADRNLEAIPGGPAADKITSPQQKIADAKDVISLLDAAKPLVEKATGSYGGVALDAGARLIGKSTDGAEAAAQLRVLEGNLVSKMPKMSGPQSDKDVLLYKQMAGLIGDPTVPKETKLAAMQTIREINQRYIDTAQVPARPATGDQKFDMLPPASQYNGKRMKADNGTIYRSEGGRWVKE